MHWLPTVPVSGPSTVADLHADRYTTRPGAVVLDAVDEHRIKVHTGRPVTGTCGVSRFRYARGDVDLLPAGSADSWQEDTGSTSVMLRFAPALLARTADELGLDGARVGLPLRHQFRDERIAQLAWALDADHRDGQSSGRLYTDSLSTALLAHLVARHRSAQEVDRGLPRQQLLRVTDHIEAHLEHDLSLARLADIAGISASHLKTQFKRATGLPVHAYVVRRRVERARHLLSRRDLPVSQIALEAGFAHQSHMVRSLRRVLGAEAAPLLRRGAGKQ
ncbi:MAG TPA: AraC family transcriptional regulator [Lysobacter sp.]